MKSLIKECDESATSSDTVSVPDFVHVQHGRHRQCDRRHTQHKGCVALDTAQLVREAVIVVGTANVDGSRKGSLRKRSIADTVCDHTAAVEADCTLDCCMNDQHRHNRSDCAAKSLAIGSAVH